MDGFRFYLSDQPKTFSFLLRPVSVTGKNNVAHVLPVQRNLVNLLPNPPALINVLPRVSENISPNQQTVAPKVLPQLFVSEIFKQKKYVPILPKPPSDDGEKKSSEKQEKQPKKAPKNAKIVEKRKPERKAAVPCNEIVDPEFFKTTMICEGYNFNWKDHKKPGEQY